MAEDPGGGRLRTWWWDLPLRRKGLVVIALPTVSLVAGIVVAMVLTAQQATLRADTRADRVAQGLSADVLQHLTDLEGVVLGAAIIGETSLLDDWSARRSDFERDVAALVDQAPDHVAGPVRDAADAVTADVERLDQLRRSVMAGDLDASGRAEFVAGRGSNEVRAAFAALDTRLDANIIEVRDAIDDRDTAIMVVLIASMAMAVLTAFLMVRLFTRGITQRVAAVSDTAVKVLGGDYDGIDIEDPANDELGALFRHLRTAATLLITNNAELERTMDHERQRLRQEQVIGDVSRRVHEAIGQEGVLSAAVRELGPAVESDRVLLLAVEEGTQLGPVLAEWAAEGLPPLGVGQRLPPNPARDANMARLIADRNPLLIEDVTSSTELLPQTASVLAQFGARSVLIAPVVADQGPLAILVVFNANHGRPLPQGSSRMAAILTAELATAIVHARLYERELEMVERLRELDQAKSDFVASVSHELRTPLTSIRGYVEMLSDGDAGELEPDQRQMLDVVQRNADRLLALIEDLLTLSRIESGSFRVILAPVALDDLVATTVAELRPQAESHGVRLVHEVPAELRKVSGDTGQLERILLNLLSNAIKFTPDGGDVNVRLRSAGDVVELDVADHGIGIPQSEQAHLFERFFRSSTAHERAIQGTGLGLVIVKSIVDHHGGEIAVRSAPGAGTTFTVRLPFAALTPAVAGG